MIELGWLLLLLLLLMLMKREERRRALRDDGPGTTAWVNFHILAFDVDQATLLVVKPYMMKKNVFLMKLKLEPDRRILTAKM